MARAGCRDWEGMDAEKKQSQRLKQYQEQASDAKLDTAVRTAWAQLPPEKRAAALAA